MGALMGVFLLLLLVSPALGQTASRPASVQINGGQFTLATNGANVVFPSLTLSGLPQVAVASTVPTFTIIDARGTGAGWKLSVQSTDFVSGGRTIPATGYSFLASGGTVTAVYGQSVGAGGPAETGLSGNLNAVLKVLSSNVDWGMGYYRYTPNSSNLTLQVPAETYAGTYTAVMTFTLATGP
ncbi:MAG: WxL domain-containing protein [Candidatus Eremiobacterota bacterium]